MKFIKVVFAWIAVMLLGLVAALTAFHAEDATKAENKKARKAAKETADTTSQTESNAIEAAKKTTPTPERIVLVSEIEATKASGKVCVSTDSGVYHKRGKWHGATKAGKFMTE